MANISVTRGKNTPQSFESFKVYREKIRRVGTPAEDGGHEDNSLDLHCCRGIAIWAAMGGVVAVKRQFLPGGGAKIPDADHGEGKSVKQTQLLRSKCCALSQTELEEPVVACELGNLYNKEAVLDTLLKKNMPPELAHIRTTKDLTEAKFHFSPSGVRSCPLTGLDFNGIIPFVLVWKTGYVLSEKAVKEMGISDLQGEYGPFTSDDLVRLIPLECDLEKAQKTMKDRREFEALRKKKKRRRLRMGTSCNKWTLPYPIRRERRRAIQRLVSRH